MAPSVCQRVKGGLSGSIRQKHWRSNNGAVALLATRNTGGGGGGAGEELSRLYSLDFVMMMQPWTNRPAPQSFALLICKHTLSFGSLRNELVGVT